MATKTFKIGEYCKGGIISVETTAKKVIVIGKIWDYSKGSSKGSDQSNAKEFTRLEVMTDEPDAEKKVDWFLFDLTTSYYAGQVLDWINTKTKFKAENIW